MCSQRYLAPPSHSQVCLRHDSWQNRHMFNLLHLSILNPAGHGQLQVFVDAGTLQFPLMLCCTAGRHMQSQSVFLAPHEHQDGPAPGLLVQLRCSSTARCSMPASAMVSDAIQQWVGHACSKVWGQESLQLSNCLGTWQACCVLCCSGHHRQAGWLGSINRDKPSCTISIVMSVWQPWCMHACAPQTADGMQHPASQDVLPGQQAHASAEQLYNARSPLEWIPSWLCNHTTLCCQVLVTPGWCDIGAGLPLGGIDKRTYTHAWPVPEQPQFPNPVFVHRLHTTPACPASSHNTKPLVDSSSRMLGALRTCSVPHAGTRQASGGACILHAPAVACHRDSRPTATACCSSAPAQRLPCSQRRQLPRPSRRVAAAAGSNGTGGPSSDGRCCPSHPLVQWTPVERLDSCMHVPLQTLRTWSSWGQAQQATQQPSMQHAPTSSQWCLRGSPMAGAGSS